MDNAVTPAAPTCNAVGCERRPTHYLVLRVPAIGHSMRDALSGTIGLTLCRDHAEDAEPDTFTNGPAGEAIVATLQGARLMPPDFDRAELEVRRIGDANWIGFMGQQASKMGAND